MTEEEIRAHYADGGTPEMLMFTYVMRLIMKTGSVLDEYEATLNQLEEDTQERRINIESLREELANPPRLKGAAT